MKKLPTKQIYLLTIIIVGIIALSVYSTYALFTFESSISNVVSIHTPNSLKISENIYEYEQITVEPNTVTTTDIDIYNDHNYNTCYSVWYKIIENNIDKYKVQVFENSNEALNSSGILASSSNIRVKLVIINDNDKQIKINIGTIGSKKDGESCSLNIAKDKNTIIDSYQKIEALNDKILEQLDKTKEEEANYIIYENITDIITHNEKDKLYVSESFDYNDEIFTLKEVEHLTIKEIIENYINENKTIYFCKNDDNCKILYKINQLEQQVIEEEKTDVESIKEDVEKEIYYDIKSYDKLIGYSKSTNGLRKINETDYIYYGDNPDNYVYYNCKNDNDTKTCELWRIIGMFYNKETEKYNVKIIKNSSIGKYQFNNTKTSTNVWNQTTLHKYLNEEYKLINNYDVYIEEYIQEIERIPNLEIDIKNMKVSNETTSSKITLLNLSDYLYTSSCQKNKINEYNEECFKDNWLNNIEVDNEWTLTTKEIIESKEKEISENIETTTEEKIEIEPTNYTYSVNNIIKEDEVTSLLEVRPVIFVKSRMLLIDGEGTFEKPYIIK